MVYYGSLKTFYSDPYPVHYLLPEVSRLQTNTKLMAMRNFASTSERKAISESSLLRLIIRNIEITEIFQI